MLSAFWSKVNGYKTYAVMIAMMLYAVVVVGWQGGDWNQAAQLFLGAAGLGGLRNALPSVK